LAAGALPSLSLGALPEAHGITAMASPPSRLLEPFSGGSGDGSYPPEQEEVVATKLASEGQQEPVDRPLDGVPGAHAAEFYGSAIRTVTGEHA
jgi:hypothetical protein